MADTRNKTLLATSGLVRLLTKVKSKVATVDTVPYRSSWYGIPRIQQLI